MACWRVSVSQSTRTSQAARGEAPAVFGRRCIPADCVAPRSNIGHILARRALSAGRLAGLGATLEFHHGLLTARGRSGDYATVSALLARKQKAPRKSSSLRSLKVTDSFKTFVLEQLADL